MSETKPDRPLLTRDQRRRLAILKESRDIVCGLQSTIGSASRPMLTQEQFVTVLDIYALIDTGTQWPKSQMQDDLERRGLVLSEDQAKKLKSLLDFADEVKGRRSAARRG